MGTRGIVGVCVDGIDKMAYNHFDSYPECLGVSMLGQCRKLVKRAGGLATAQDAARAIRLVNDTTPVTAEDVKKYAIVTDLEVGNQSPYDWYCLLRGAQGNLLAYLDGGIMLDAATFILDSLFCEWGYIVNLDTEKLEVYKGFQRQPHDKGRFTRRKLPNGDASDRLYPCALVAEFDLRKLPTKAKFLKATNK
jgi:hypothetical protein